jgi:hypothetical protein
MKYCIQSTIDGSFYLSVHGTWNQVKSIRKVFTSEEKAWNYIEEKLIKDAKVVIAV